MTAEIPFFLEPSLSLGKSLCSECGSRAVEDASLGDRQLNMRQDPFYEISWGLDVASLPAKWVAQSGILSQKFLTASFLMHTPGNNKTKLGLSRGIFLPILPPSPQQMTSSHAHDAVLTLSRWMMEAVIIWPVQCVAVNSVGFVWKRSQTCITSGEMRKCLFFFLEYNCFTVLCEFLLYNEVNKSAKMYTSLLPPPSHPCRSSQSTKLSSLYYTAVSH